MKWKKYTIETTTAATDFISEMLSEIGIEGIEIEDFVPLTEEETKGMFIDILPELPPDDGSARISFYLEAGQEPEEREAVLSAVREGLEEIALFVDAGSCAITEGETEDIDWVNNWKEFFKPFTVDDILIKPTWEEIPAEHRDKLLISIDPGTAFGTGSHETTQLCIRQIRKYLKPGDRVLDIGTGSGILSIAALKSGAAHVLATDLDECAVTAARENAEVNGIPQEQYTVLQGNILEDAFVQDMAGDSCFDIAAANILAPVILLLIGEVFRHVKPGGLFITSGILDVKEEEVARAFRADPNWELLETTRQGEWVSLTARRCSDGVDTRDRKI